MRRGSLAQFQEASARLLLGIAERTGTGKPLPGTLFPELAAALGRIEDEEHEQEPVVTLSREIAKALDSLCRAQELVPVEPPSAQSDQRQAAAVTRA
jgi:hypothetical protein